MTNNNNFSITYQQLRVQMQLLGEKEDLITNWFVLSWGSRLFKSLRVLEWKQNQWSARREHDLAQNVCGIPQEKVNITLTSLESHGKRPVSSSYLFTLSQRVKKFAQLFTPFQSVPLKCIAVYMFLFKSYNCLYPCILNLEGHEEIEFCYFNQKRRGSFPDAAAENFCRTVLKPFKRQLLLKSRSINSNYPECLFQQHIVNDLINSNLHHFNGVIN